MTIRDKVSAMFEISMGHDSFPNYLARLNTGGKVTQRSMMELIGLCLQSIEELENGTGRTPTS